jgi:hypothetical protein
MGARYVACPLGSLSFALEGDDTVYLKLEPHSEHTHIALTFENEHNEKQPPPPGFNIFRDGSSKPLDYPPSFVFALVKGETFRVFFNEAVMLHIEPQCSSRDVKFWMHNNHARKLNSLHLRLATRQFLDDKHTESAKDRKEKLHPYAHANALAAAVVDPLLACVKDALPDRCNKHFDRRLCELFTESVSKSLLNFFRDHVDEIRDFKSTSRKAKRDVTPLSSASVAKSKKSKP